MERQPRFFTLEEARRTLPLVERIVRDIVEAYPAFQEHLQQFHHLATRPGGALLQERLAELRRQIDRESNQINEFIRELHQIGCLFKGFEEGLVDFYALYRGQPIFLCWKLGEEEIRYWHEVDTGYAGRRPITPDMRDALGSPDAASADTSS